MKKISAKIVADSVNSYGDRITTMLLTYPRFIHGEVLTHRVFSKNSASSRAIPFEKMVKMVEEDPFIPIAWQKDHKGMQGNEYFTGVDVETNNKVWLQARDNAIRDAILMNRNKVTKQLCNRLLEPFMWHTVLLTATEYDNFFELRCPKYEWDNKVFKSRKNVKNYAIDKNQWNVELDNLQWLVINKSQAEIHMQALAEAMWDAMNESTPVELKAGEWHIPFGDKISDGELRDYFYNVENNPDPSFTAYQRAKLKISTAGCARLSYMTFDGEIDHEKDIQLHDRLLADGHMSPLEHCARAMSDEEYFCYHKGIVEGEFDSDMEIGSFFRILEEPKFMKDKRNGWCNNYKGFIQYRYMIDNYDSVTE